MNFEYIEELVTKCKNDDKISKEKLAIEFRPFILNLSRKTFIDRYEMQDIQNQCYESLFKSVRLYNLETPTHISYILNNKRDPSIELLNKIATALDVPIEEIFEDKHFKDNNIFNKDNSSTEKRHQIDTIAAHLEEKNLTPQKLKLLNDYIDALFSEEF
jgi:transcriptional regulator with XRE-family HTH domain